MFAEINPAYRFIGNDFIRAAAGQYRALIDDIGAVADAQRFAHIMVGDQHTDAAFLEEAHDALNFNDGNRINPGKGLVEQHEARVGGQRTGDFDAPPFAAR